ncbi:MAG: MazG-like family protein [Syntrophaceticus sp.]|nr:MazG-like family protein [Syntrophaceticus sp.]MDD3314286.1 MazG-like family protein [Syntrophaceticus sp.]MDD4359102.1 MazG-like family protein [Syntrophaceticus sp.]MDD4782335.1 MazG-like family protein [Syntrophaceticus sp.]HBG21757.1 nucleotide pyrophosphohydrolase [Peptococcaceae bacterium]
MKTKDITLPRLNNLQPTLESTAFKLMEETGELAQAIGKFRGMSGERTEMSEQQVMDMILRELLDVAQTAVSLMFVLEEEYGADIGLAMERHIEKLIEKEYICVERNHESKE